MPFVYCTDLPESSTLCSNKPTPPMTTTCLKPISAPKAPNCSDIWRASSRVGVSTTAKTLRHGRDEDRGEGAIRAAVLERVKFELL